MVVVMVVVMCLHMHVDLIQPLAAINNKRCCLLLLYNLFLHLYAAVGKIFSDTSRRVVRLW